MSSSIYRQINWGNKDPDVKVQVDIVNIEKLHEVNTNNILSVKETNFGTNIITFTGGKDTNNCKFLLARKDYEKSQGDSKYQSLKELSTELIQDLINHMQENDVLDSFIDKFTKKHLTN